MTLLEFGQLSLDTETQILKAPRGEVRLTYSHYAMMALLMQRGNKITTLDLIVSEIWPYPREEAEHSHHTIRCLIKNLRGFIKIAGALKVSISLERGCGYYLKNNQHE